MRVCNFFLSADDFFPFSVDLAVFLPSFLCSFHTYLGLPWFLRPSMYALSVFLITHYLSFCFSRLVGVKISDAFL